MKGLNSVYSLMLVVGFVFSLAIISMCKIDKCLLSPSSSVKWVSFDLCNGIHQKKKKGLICVMAKKIPIKENLQYRQTAFILAVELIFFHTFANTITIYEADD